MIGPIVCPTLLSSARPYLHAPPLITHCCILQQNTIGERGYPVYDVREGEKARRLRLQLQEKLQKSQKEKYQSWKTKDM